MHRRFAVLVAGIMLCCVSSIGALELSVMTFNIRYGSASDGADSWTNRRELVFDVLRNHRPDVAGLQEVLAFQREQILAACPDFDGYGTGRNRDGGGEQACILFRRDRLRFVEGGTFWLSKTPDVPGSKDWASSLPRICTWARLATPDGGKALIVFDTHLDHRSATSREQAARIIAERIQTIAGAKPAVLTGDFNAGEASDPILFLQGRMEGQPPGPRLVDTFRAVHPDEKNVRTSHSFRGGRLGEKIDFVFAWAGVTALDAAIVRDATDGRYPSDHYPVTARVRIP